MRAHLNGRVMWILAVVTALSPPNFCRECGSASMRLRVPDGDERQRAVCDACGYVEYVNPKVVCGCVVKSRGRVLLAKRAIEPRRGYWGVPQGFMECGETTRQAAVRETREETGVELLGDLDLLAVYNLPNQVQVLYEVCVEDCVYSTSTKESLEVRLFDFDHIPWDNLAFPTVDWALRFALGERRGVQERTKVLEPTGEWVVLDETKN